MFVQRQTPAPSMDPLAHVITVFKDVKGREVGSYNAIGLYSPPPYVRRLPPIPKGFVWDGPYYHGVLSARVQKTIPPRAPFMQKPRMLMPADGSKHHVDTAKRAKSPAANVMPLPVPAAAKPTPPVRTPEPAASANAGVNFGKAARIGAWVLGLGLLAGCTWAVSGFYVLWLASCELFALTQPKAP